ncbi:MAG: DNA replication and repair protein RecF [SAR86 cluster bacterium]|nr:DNA replication and repair protein RecF [SAR86 cluster bacterium]
MIIKQLKVSNFRSYELLDITISSGISLFHGENGAGKSTILEAIQHNLSGRSFRTQNIDDIIQKGSSQFKTKVIFENNKFIQSEKLLNTTVKHVNSDNKIQKIRELLEAHPLCLLESNDFFFNSSNPEKKRSYLNKALFYVEQNHIDLLRKLKKIHNQRNHALKIGSYEDIKLWTEQLCDIEPLITKQNKAIISNINTRIKDSALVKTFLAKNAWISDIELIYNTGFGEGVDLNEVLSLNLKLDKLLKRTNEGPHKRKFTIKSNNEDVNLKLSRGQQKLLSIILHVLQKEIIDEHTLTDTLLLLDDISSELDSDNLKKMLKYLEEHTEQTLMTSITNTSFNDINDLQMFHVEQRGGVSYVR